MSASSEWSWHSVRHFDLLVLIPASGAARSRPNADDPHDLDPRHRREPVPQAAERNRCCWARARRIPQKPWDAPRCNSHRTVKYLFMLGDEAEEADGRADGMDISGCKWFLDCTSYMEWHALRILCSNSTPIQQPPRWCQNVPNTWNFIHTIIKEWDYVLYTPTNTYIPYHTIPYHTIPYHTIPYHTIPYHTIPYHTIPYHIYMNILKDHFKQVMVYESAASEGKLPGIQPRCPRKIQWTMWWCYQGGAWDSLGIRREESQAWKKWGNFSILAGAAVRMNAWHRRWKEAFTMLLGNGHLVTVWELYDDLDSFKSNHGIRMPFPLPGSP